jgi:L-lactate dehydrogenase complex protein LldG
MNDPSHVISKVRAALGRREPLAAAPTPPVLDEPVVRLVHSDFGLPELFVKMAADNQMSPERVYVEELAERVANFLRQQDARQIALPASPLLEKTGVTQAIRSGGFDARQWDTMTLDELYEFDASVTDVYAAVAETGSLVVRASPGHGRSLSLVPRVHVAVVEPKNFVGDLVDLFEKMAKDGVASGTSIITGPSRTADIEMSLVVGVHGPTVVKVFILQ